MSTLDPSAKVEAQKPDIEREQKLLIKPDSLSANIDLSLFPHSEITQGYIHEDAVISLKGTPEDHIQVIYFSKQSNIDAFTEIPITDYQYNKLSQVALMGEDGYGVIHCDATVRVRSNGGEFFQTLKLPTSENEANVKSKIEVEFEIDTEQYKSLSSCIDGNLIKKTRYVLAKSESFEVVCDVFREEFDGLVLVEVEAKRETGFDKIILPPWIAEAKNVSNIPGFSNAELARMSREEINQFMKTVVSIKQ